MLNRYLDADSVKVCRGNCKQKTWGLPRAIFNRKERSSITKRFVVTYSCT